MVTSRRFVQITGKELNKITIACVKIPQARCFSVLASYRIRYKLMTYLIKSNNNFTNVSAFF